MPKGKKKGSAKKKKGSAKGKRKSSATASVIPEAPKVKWPWQDAAKSWMGGRDLDRDRMMAHFRHHYIENEGIICSQQEWMDQLQSYAPPLNNPKEEALVQMLVTILGKFGLMSSSMGDNPKVFAAAVRCRHPTQHFTNMLEMMQQYFLKTDEPDRFNELIAMFMRLNGQPDGHVRKDEARFRIEQLQITVGLKAWLEKVRREEEEALAAGTAEPTLFDVFLDHLKERELRLVDLFRQFDKDGSGTLTKEEVRNGIMHTKIAMSESQLIELIDLLDLDGDGEIDYQEFAIGRADAIQARRELQRGEVQMDQTGAVFVGGVKADVLQMTFESFIDLVLYCHYATRP